VRELKLARNLDVDPPEGVTVQRRAVGEDFPLPHNFAPGSRRSTSRNLVDVTDGTTLTGKVTLPASPRASSRRADYTRP
jgi:hypothetical protein